MKKRLTPSYGERLGRAAGQPKATVVDRAEPVEARRGISKGEEAGERPVLADAGLHTPVKTSSDRLPTRQ